MANNVMRTTPEQREQWLDECVCWRKRVNEDYGGHPYPNSQQDKIAALIEDLEAALRELAEMKRQRDILLELDVHKALAEQREAKEVAEEALRSVFRYTGVGKIEQDAEVTERVVNQYLKEARARIASRKGLQA